jgi:signal transduction histidine kinase
VDVGELVAQQTKLHQLKADKPVNFKTDIQPQPLTLRADRTHLANMLSNLIDNAIKYSEGEAEVTICCRKGMIAVSDKGIGIARERLPHIFERFYRVPQGNRHDVKGYGLGLYYVQQMMLKHGGSVEAESQEGKGTTIRLIWNQ